MDVTCHVMYHVFVQSYPIRKEIRFFSLLSSKPTRREFWFLVYYHRHLSSQKTNCKADRTAKKGNKIITLLSCPISLAIGFLFYSTLLILIYTKIRLHLATVCPSGPCIELLVFSPSQGGDYKTKNHLF